MQAIQSEDKMIASSHRSDVADRAAAPSRSEGRPRKPLVLLLSGLILIGVGAPPMAEPAYATPAKVVSKHEKCIQKRGYRFGGTISKADEDRFTKLYCDKKFGGVVLSKEDEDWLHSVL
jgi:hypothetical protein